MEPNEVNAGQMSLKDLKALAYDLINQLEKTRQALDQVNQLIRQQQTPEPNPEKKPTKLEAK